jgi:hypothetical protein
MFLWKVTLRLLLEHNTGHTSSIALSMFLFHLLINKRTHLSKCRMPPLPIIGDFEILEKCLPGLFMGGVDLVASTFLFERPEETLPRCMIPTLAFA